MNDRPPEEDRPPEPAPDRQDRLGDGAGAPDLPDEGPDQPAGPGSQAEPPSTPQMDDAPRADPAPQSPLDASPSTPEAEPPGSAGQPEHTTDHDVVEKGDGPPDASGDGDPPDLPSAHEAGTDRAGAPGDGPQSTHQAVTDQEMQAAGAERAADDAASAEAVTENTDRRDASTDNPEHAPMDTTSAAAGDDHGAPDLPPEDKPLAANHAIDDGLVSTSHREGTPASGSGEARERYRPCFLAGTLVQREGQSTPIEAVVPGDRVLGAALGHDMKVGHHRVTKLHRGRTRLAVAVDIGAGTVLCTRGHLFFVPGVGWTRAEQLRVGQPVAEAGGGHLLVSAVRRLRLDEDTVTYDLTVEHVANYFVAAADHLVLVHNGGDDDYDGVRYWFFGKKPRLRDDDVDGLSVWKTTSREDVETLMAHRVNTVGRQVKDPHGYFTQEELDRAGLSYPETESSDPLAEKLSHHSIRPRSAEDYPASLDAAQMDDLRQTLSETAWENVKPSEITC